MVVEKELRNKNMLQSQVLALRIVDVGWRALLNMLSHKAYLYGQQLVALISVILLNL